jgi:hypothetical protein
LGKIIQSAYACPSIRLSLLDIHNLLFKVILDLPSPRKCLPMSYLYPRAHGHFLPAKIFFGRPQDHFRKFFLIENASFTSFKGFFCSYFVYSIKRLGTVRIIFCMQNENIFQYLLNLYQFKNRKIWTTDYICCWGFVLF